MGAIIVTNALSLNSLPEFDVILLKHVTTQVAVISITHAWCSQNLRSL
ncbi:MAG: hypothetical protein JSR33_01205 [Proteobacteria bacterium]|nr:hypothetical protein [Pseudomonadota bacterium]